MIRLSEARARCELRDEVTASDARDIIQIMKSALWDSFETDGGTLEFSRSQLGTGASKQAQTKKFVAFLKEFARQHGRLFSYEQLESFASSICD